MAECGAGMEEGSDEGVGAGVSNKIAEIGQSSGLANFWLRHRDFVRVRKADPNISDHAQRAWISTPH